MPRLISTFLVAASLATAGCSTINATLGGNSEGEARAQLVWSYAENAIALDIVSDDRLNEHDSQAHTLMVAVVQTADVNSLTSLLADSGAVAKLLETGKPGPGTLSVDRFIVRPGSRVTTSLSRAEFAKYLGIIPGYFQLDPKRNARIFRIGVQVESKGLMIKNRIATPAPLDIRVELGALQLSGMRLLNVKPGAAEGDVAENTSAQPGKLNVDAKSVLDAGRAAQSIKQLTR